MKIPVTLNGTKTILDAHAYEPLMKVLHKNGCLSVKSGCSQGFCGSCTILLDDHPAASCKIPAGIVRNSDIVTLDYFVKTEEYSIIMAGFQKAGIKLCGYCNAGKIFCTYQILKSTKMLTREEIVDYVKTLSPCCTDLDTLVNGIVYAMQIANKKLRRG